MKFLKESFLKFNTYTQIQIGVIGVAFCIFFISVCLLSIISLILINTTYTDIEAMLELKENDQINGVSLYVDSQINIATEMSKIYQSSTRSFIQNNIRNKNFINNFKSQKYNNYIKKYNNPNSTSEIYYIYERCFSEQQINNEYENIKKILAAYIQVIDYTHFTKYYKNNDDSMFKLISYYNNENKCLLYYPYQEFTANYTVNNFKVFMNYQLASINRQLDQYIINYNLNNTKSSIAINLNSNPMTTGYSSIPEKGLVEFYKNEIYKGETNLMISSTKFYENSTSIFDKTTNNFTLSDIKDLLVFEFSDSMVDKLLIKNLNRFPSFKTIVVTSKLLGKTACEIMQKIYKFYNWKSQNLTIPSLISEKDCFLFTKEGDNQTYFSKFFGNNPILFKNQKNETLNSELTDNFRRFAKIPIAYNSNYPESIERAINFKILKFRAADITTRILINSFFTVWLRPHVYILKNYSLISNNFKIIYTRLLSTQLKIISLNILISVITGAIVVYLTFRVSKSIGDPISKLISIVKNINPQKEKKNSKKKNQRKSNTRPSITERDGKSVNSKSLKDKKDTNVNEKTNAQNEIDREQGNPDLLEEDIPNDENEDTRIKNESTVTTIEEISKEKNLDNIKFEDDETINKFFNICKKLIKGGLSDENNKVKQIHYNDDAYNNISFMKSNNLIVQEEKILKETESRSDKIFSHRSLIEAIKLNNNYNYDNNKSSNNVDKKSNRDYSSQNNASEISINNINNDNNNLIGVNSLKNNINNNLLLSNKLTFNKNTNVFVNMKNGDEIKEIRLETTKINEKPVKTVANILNSNKQLNAYSWDNNQKSSIFYNSDLGKGRNQSVDIFPIFKETKSEVEVYFQNTKINNSLNLNYDNINFLLHSNIERKKTEGAENNLFNEETEFDNIVKKHFNKEILDKIFEIIKNVNN